MTNYMVKSQIRLRLWPDLLHKSGSGQISQKQIRYSPTIYQWPPQLVGKKDISTCNHYIAEYNWTYE